MSDVGYATLQIIPSMDGIGRKLSRGITGPSRTAGLQGGRSMGRGMVRGLLLSKTGITVAATTLGLGAGAAAGLAVAAGLAAVPLAFAGIGIAAAATNEKVKSAFSGLASEVKNGLISAAAPIVPVLVNVADRFASAFRTILPAIRQIFSAIAPMIGVVADAFADFVVGIMPAMVRAVKAAVPIVNAMARGFANLAPYVSKFFDILATAAGPAMAVVKGFFGFLGRLLPFIGNLLVVLTQGFMRVAGALNQNGLVMRILAQWWGVLKAAWVAIQPIINFLADLIMNTVIPALRSIWQVVSAQVIPALRRFIAAIQPLIQWLVGKLGPIIKKVFNAAAQVIRGAMQAIAGIINLFTSIIKGDWSGAWNAIKQIFSGVWTAIKGILKAAWAIIKGVVLAAMKNVWNTIKTWWNKALDFIKSIPGKIKRGLGNLGRLLVSAGRDIIRGLINGIKAMAGRVADAAADVVKGAIAGAKAALKIRSPSRVFREIGQFMSEGMALGIDDNAGMVTKATNALASTKQLNAAASGIHAGQAPGGQEIRVFIGDQELRGMVRTEVQETNRQLKRRVLAGAV